ncbi:MAG TPA: RNA polymerase sigma factor [Gaiellaceae bacterium]|nr:RNA polymerase sigma factor [Gaiellaceae bacterium]
MSADAWRPSGLDTTYARLRAVEESTKARRLETLLERHESRLRRVAYGMLADPSRVDDVLQEALLRAYRRLPVRFESAGHEAAWLYRIVHRCCLNELRSRRRRRETPGVPVEAHVSAGDDAVLASVAVAAALAQLHDDARAVVLLVDLIGLDYETAAAALGIPRGTVASRLSAARAALRAAFAAERAAQ